MDTAVALVQTYLNINGYFTVVEYPVLEASRDHARSVTDLDVLAFRFPHAGHQVVKGHQQVPLSGHVFEPDAALGCPGDRPDMIVGEVKESAARFNDATCDPAVLQIALARFGCCPLDHSAHLAERLLSRGSVETPSGHTVRMIAFGSVPDATARAHWTTISMHHVVKFLRDYVQQHWNVLRHAQIKDSTLGLLALLQKFKVADQTRDDSR